MQSMAVWAFHPSARSDRNFCSCTMERDLLLSSSSCLLARIKYYWNARSKAGKEQKMERKDGRKHLRVLVISMFLRNESNRYFRMKQSMHVARSTRLQQKDFAMQSAGIKP